MIYISDAKIIRPALSICKTPIQKDESKYQDFLKNIQSDIYTNEEDFNAQVDEIFFNQPKDFILAMNIAPSYEEVIKNFTRIPISPPYVRMVFSDYIYNGFCAVVSYSALNNFLIEKGEVKRTDMDFSFYHVVYLNVSNFTKSVFLAKLIRSAKLS